MSFAAVVLIIDYCLTTGIGMFLERIDHGQVLCLLYILLTKSKDNDDITFGFDESNQQHKEVLNKKKGSAGQW